MQSNFWVGPEELIIVYYHGTYAVLSDWGYTPLCVGTYEKCVEYCTWRVTAYEESIVG